MHLVGGTAVELQVARQRHGISAALLERLAHVQRLQAGQFVGLLQHQRAHLHQQAAALGGGQPAPRSRAVAFHTPLTLQGDLRGAHGRVDVGGVAAGDAGEFAAVRRVDERQRLAAVTGAPAAGDEDQGGVEGHGIHEEQGIGRL